MKERLLVGTLIVCGAGVIVLGLLRPQLILFLAAGVAAGWLARIALRASEAVPSAVTSLLIVLLCGALAIVMLTRTVSFMVPFPEKTERTEFIAVARLIEGRGPQPTWSVVTRIALTATNIDRILQASRSTPPPSAEAGIGDRDAAIGRLTGLLAGTGYDLTVDQGTTLVISRQSEEPILGPQWPRTLAPKTVVSLREPRLGEVRLEPNDDSVVTLIVPCHALIALSPHTTAPCIDNVQEFEVSLKSPGTIERSAASARLVHPSVRVAGIEPLLTLTYGDVIGWILATIGLGVAAFLKDEIKESVKRLFKKQAATPAA